MVWDHIDFESLSPMMQHYVSTKRAYPDALILYRLGDFYEMFFEDAEVGSKVLEIALTGKYCGLEDRAPMCGVPHQAIDSYTSKLVDKGYKVVIVDQMEDPAQAVGLVKRAVTRVLTPGTLTDADALEGKENNFLLCFYFYQKKAALCYADLSTGEIATTEVDLVEDPVTFAHNWMATIKPSEILLLNDGNNREILEKVSLFLEKLAVFISRLDVDPKKAAQARDRVENYLGPTGRKEVERHLVAAMAVSSLLDYIYAFQEDKLSHLNLLQWLESDRYMMVNASSRENLELDRNLFNHSRKGSLLDIMDRTKTAMGGRLLGQWLDMPLMELDAINQRLDLVEAFKDRVTLSLPLRESLSKVYDLERLLGKFSYQRGNARDLLSLALSLSPLPKIQSLVESTDSAPVRDFFGHLDSLSDIKDLIDRAIVDEPPITITDGGMIRPGFSEELDRIRSGSDEAKKALVKYEAEEKKRTGISNLRIIYRKNAGYFIEVTQSNLSKVPSDYRRQQTLKNAERYTTNYLESQAGRITGDESAIKEMEYSIFQKIRQTISDQAIRIQDTAKLLAKLDVLLSLATLASDEDYVRPHFHKGGQDRITIIEGRHPVVEVIQEEEFIGNDLDIGAKDNRIQIITGPNMAGKSTFMRQNALILIMAQMGSFVPAKSCDLPITDKVLTRIGARDHLQRGESTFMVEMKEMAEILEEATSSSFLVLDEVGRGTSTNDGLSIAYAILEYLDAHKKPKTLFATHYHELTSLAGKKNSISNRKVDIKEEDGQLIFLRKVVEGMTDRSYGIEVAKLSGLPEEILVRANYILSNIDAINDLSFVKETPKASDHQEDFSDFRRRALLEEMARVDVNALSPVQALTTLDGLIRQAQEMIEEDDR
ncbi:DNA mismatch repair protein MutS [Kallipyga massiliensis]|uniref:DNA mismatch repair protein MutS n=1 Tax=Kallipyga massiliensis TaxID=1472764 RepID=UPI0026ECC50D|nr:DNA mismatch repair protein MutS [Kallipyga massiliensis]